MAQDQPVSYTHLPAPAASAKSTTTSLKGDTLPSGPMVKSTPAMSTLCLLYTSQNPRHPLKLQDRGKSEPTQPCRIALLTGGIGNRSGICAERCV